MRVVVVGGLVALLWAQSPLPSPPPNDACFSNHGYRFQHADQGIVVFTKSSSQQNCLKLTAYKDAPLTLDLQRQGPDLYLRVDPARNGTVRAGEAELRVTRLHTSVAVQDPITHRAEVYATAEAADIIAALPLSISRVGVAVHGRTILSVFLDAERDAGAFKLREFDRLVFLVELFATMPLLDVGVAVLFIDGGWVAVALHAWAMWLVLFAQLFSLAAFMLRFQPAFISQPLFLRYFLSSVAINAFQILTAASGAHLRAAVLDRYVYQDTIFSRRLHRGLGLTAYLLAKLNIAIKWAMVTWVLGAAPSPAMIVVLLLSPALWAFWVLRRVAVLATKNARQARDVVRLARHTTTLDRRPAFFELVRELRGVAPWFVHQNAIYVLKDDHVHPGGNFFIERLHRRHATKYLWGAAAVEAFPYRRLRHRHTEGALGDQAVKRKMVFAAADVLQGATDEPWAARSCERLLGGCAVVRLRSAHARANLTAAEQAAQTLGQYFMVHRAGSPNREYSFVQLTRDVHYTARRALYCHRLLQHLQPPKHFTSAAVTGVWIDFSSAARSSFIHPELLERYIEKFRNLPLDGSAPRTNELHLLLQLPKKGSFIDALEPAEALLVEQHFMHRLGPARLASGPAMHVEGPYGFERLIDTDREYLFYTDEWGLSALHDFSFAFLCSILAELGDKDPALTGFSIPQIRLGIVCIMPAPRLNTLNELLVTFCLGERAISIQRVQRVFAFEDEPHFDRFLTANAALVNEADMHIIAAKFTHAHMFFRNLRKKVSTQKIFVI